MKKTFIPLIATVLFTLQSCTVPVSDYSFGKTKVKESPLTVETIRDTYVNAVHTSSGIKVEYIQGNDTEITIEAPEAVKKYLDIKAAGSVLVCRRTGNVNLGNELKKVKVTVKSPCLIEAEASSGASITAASINIPERSFTASASSGAAISIGSLKANGVDAVSSSGGAISMTAVTSKDLDLISSSGAAVSAKNISVGSLTATASSGAALKVAGKAEDATLNSSSGAALSAAGLEATSLTKGRSSGGTLSM